MINMVKSLSNTMYPTAHSIKPLPHLMVFCRPFCHATRRASKICALRDFFSLVRAFIFYISHVCQTPIQHNATLSLSYPCGFFASNISALTGDSIYLETSTANASKKLPAEVVSPLVATFFHWC